MPTALLRLHPLLWATLAQPGGALPAPPTELWPTTVMGWVALGAAVLALVGGIMAWGRLLEKLNGYGERLKKVEGDVQGIHGTMEEHRRALESITAANAALAERLGEAKKAAETCTEDMREYALDIGTKLDAWRREFSAELGALRKDFHDVDKTLSTKLEGVERELRLTRGHGRGDT